jgi:death on curing protein
MRYLTQDEVLELHRAVIERFGGSSGVRDFGALQSAVMQPRMVFGGVDLYPSIAEKAAALCFSVTCNHPFLDGNKRVAHAATESFLVLNGQELAADLNDAERLVLGIASCTASRGDLLVWLRSHIVRRKQTD